MGIFPKFDFNSRIGGSSGGQYKGIFSKALQTQLVGGSSVSQSKTGSDTTGSNSTQETMATGSLTVGHTAIALLIAGVVLLTIDYTRMLLLRKKMVRHGRGLYGVQC